MERHDGLLRMGQTCTSLIETGETILNQIMCGAWLKDTVLHGSSKREFHQCSSRRQMVTRNIWGNGYLLSLGPLFKTKFKSQAFCSSNWCSNAILYASCYGGSVSEHDQNHVKSCVLRKQGFQQLWNGKVYRNCEMAQFSGLPTCRTPYMIGSSQLLSSLFSQAN